MNDMEWRDLLAEVETKGFENASPIARLAWSCEYVNGVDQHAAPDIQDIADELAALRKFYTNFLAIHNMNLNRFAKTDYYEAEFEMYPELKGIAE